MSAKRCTVGSLKGGLLEVAQKCKISEIIWRMTTNKWQIASWDESILRVLVFNGGDRWQPNYPALSLMAGTKP